MIKKTDWDAAYRDLVAGERQQPGEPPGTEELLAWSRGELSAEEAARIEARLADHPELARVLREPFPSPDEVLPGGAEDLSEEELETDWERLQARAMGWPRPARPAGRSLRTWRLSTLAAAALAAVFAVLFLQAQLEVRRLVREVATPRVDVSRRVLLPDQQRAGEPAPILLPAGAGSFLLAPSLTGGRSYPEYRLDLVDLSRPRPELLWSSAGLHPQDDQTFEVWVPRTFLRPGDYRLELHGINGGTVEPLATYTVRLAAD